MTQRLLLITGASRGIGAACAYRGAREGYIIGLNYVANEQAAQEVAAGIRDAGGRAECFRADVGSEEGVAELFGQVDDAGVALAGLVNNAGVVGQIQPFTEYTDERLRRTFAVNVFGAFACARETARRLLAQGSGGAIVQVSSAAARIGSPGEFIDYAASKGAMDTMTLGLAKELGPHGIRVNAVRPGIIDTEIHAAAGDAGRVERLAGGVPLRRPGTADEVAQTILWLLSDAAAYVNGALLDVAGGR